MSFAAMIARIKFAARQPKASQTRQKRASVLARSDFFESLEKRQLLATFSYTGTTATLGLNVANQVMTIAANATAYTFTLSGGATNTWTGTAGSGFTASGANLTANATALSNFSLFNISDSANNTAVVFGNSGANPYKDSFNITLDNNSNAILFSGNSSFLNSNALTILTDSRVELPSASSLTMANGDLSMNINMQATPRVLNFSGLMVNNGTIQTTGTGLTTIVARGGMGASSSYLNKGVAVINGGNICGGSTGTLSITGYGYTGQSATSTTLQGQGIFVYNAGGSATSTITSLGANVSVTGYGANDTNSNLVGTASSLNLVNTGVMIGGPSTSGGSQGGLITSGGNGTVTVTGYGGSAANQITAPVGSAGILSCGVSVTGSNATIQSGGSGLVTVTGFGGGAVANTPCCSGVSVFSGKISSGTNGSVVVNGTGCTTANSSNHFGVYLQGATALIAAGAGSGTTTVTGQGGGCGSLASLASGIYTTTGADITALGTGNVTVTGTGGPGSGNVNYGVQISSANTTITSNGGEVLVTGTGGGSTVSSSNTGVSLSNGATITAGGTANVTVYGYGGNNSGTSGNSNYGVQLSAGSNGQLPAKITSSGGNVIVTGTGGGGDANSSAPSSSTTNYGVFLDLGSFITAGNNGTVNVTGYGGGRSPGATGGSNFGVHLNSCTTNNNITYFSCITSGGAAVNVTGFGGGGSGTTVPASAGTNHGVYLLAGGVITTGGNAPLTVNGTAGGFGNGTSANNYGVVACGTATVANIVYRSTIASGGSGNVTLTGTGGGSLSSGINNFGVYLESGALVTAGGTDATVTVNGQGGSSSGNTNYGVYLNGFSSSNYSTITSGGGDVMVTGCGGLSSAGSNQYGVLVNGGGDITSGLNGAVTVSGTGGRGDNGSTGYGHAGVVVSGSGSLVTSGGTGPVLVTGNGGGTLARFYNHGVIVSSTGMITAGANATVTVVGRAGNNNANSTGGSNYGVLVTGAGSKVTSANGPVLISGYGGMTDPTNANATTSNYGVYLESGGEASATGSASITVNGFGGGMGTAQANYNYGVILYNLGTGNVAPKITANGGPVVINAIGGGSNANGGSNNHGINVSGGGLVSATGSGTSVTINGTGGGGSGTNTNHGIYIAGSTIVSNYTITANGGDIMLTGKEGSGSASLGFSACSTTASVVGNASTAGNITIITNSACIPTWQGSAINAGSNLVIAPRTPGTGVELGASSDTSSGPLAISDSELGRLVASNIQFGNSSTGNFTLTNGITVPSGSNLTMYSNATGTSYFPSGCASYTGISMGAGKSLDLSTIPILSACISGTYSFGYYSYSRTVVGGNLSIAGKSLALSGAYTPKGGDQFNLVQATNLTGTFNGLADGSTTTFNNRTLVVNYNATSVTLTDPAPNVTAQPANTTVTSGSLVSLSANATGIPAPSVQWQVLVPGGAWSNITNATTLDYNFTSAESDNGNQYRAYFTNSYGDATSNISLVTVNYAASITTQPANVTINDGQTATFTSAATGNPTPTVQWQVNDGSGWVDVTLGTGGTTDSYTTQTLGPNETGYQYRAVYTNSVGVTNTSAAVVTVSSGSTAPSITIQPTGQTATAGNTATFTAAASGTPTPTVQWQVNDGSGWVNVSTGSGGTTDSYTTPAATSGMSGYQYRAVYSNGVGSDATTNAVSLTVNVAPSITTQPTGQSANVGASATFTAAASGTPTPTVQWQVNDGSGWANVSTGTGGTTDSYTTPAATSGMNGYQYRAVYSNGVGSDATTNAVSLTVNSAAVAPSVTTQPVNIGVEAGQTASFTAAASGNPAPTVQWESSPDGSTGWSPVSGANAATLSFTATVGDNGKYYRAVFTNSAGSATSNAAKLAIGITPVIITGNEMTMPVGLTSGMTVIATGSPAPTYSISAGSLPSGVTLDATTGLLMGTPAAGTAGNWPVTIQATNGIGTPATQNFSLKVTSTITSFTVSKGVAQRSYIRYLDLGMDSNASALALLSNPSRLQLTKADLNGVGSTPVPLAGFLSVPTGQSTLAFDFGTIGLGNSRNTTTADGYYTLGVDLDGNGTFETNLFFFRLFGDTNGDREVTVAEQSAVLAGCSQAYNANLDTNGDGVVNTSDYQYVKKSVGRKLKSTLIVTA